MSYLYILKIFETEWQTKWWWLLIFFPACFRRCSNWRRGAIQRRKRSPKAWKVTLLIGNHCSFSWGSNFHLGKGWFIIGVRLLRTNTEQKAPVSCCCCLFVFIQSIYKGNLYASILCWVLGHSAFSSLPNCPLPYEIKASLIAQLVKNLPAMLETPVNSLVGKIPWRRDKLPTPVFWPGEFLTESQTQLSDFHLLWNLHVLGAIIENLFVT